MATKTRTTQAMEEAYASRPSDVAMLHTLEFAHQSLATPLRVVTGDEGWPEDVTNSVPNSTMQGAVVGAASNPTGWSLSLAGMTRIVSDIDQVSEVPTIDFTFSGTTTGTASYVQVTNTATAIPAAPGESWLGHIWFQVLLDDVDITDVQIRLYPLNSSGAQSGPPALLSVYATRASWQRYRLDLANLPAGTAGVALRVQFTHAIAKSINFKFRIGAPLLAKVASAATPDLPFVRTTSGPVTLQANTIQLTLEDGSTAPFTCMAFDVVPPGFDDDGPTSGKIRLDGVSDELLPILESVIAQAGSIDVTFSCYQSNLRSEVGDLVSGLKLKQVTLTETSFEGAISFDEVGVQAFPRATYTIDDYRGLFQG